MVISCTTGPTPHYVNGCELLKYYDTNNDGIISQSEAAAALIDYLSNSILTKEEASFVVDVYNAGGSIISVCPGCYSACTTPLCLFALT